MTDTTTERPTGRPTARLTGTTAAHPTAILRRSDDLPFVDAGDGTHLQVLQVDLAAGVWTLRTRFEPGTTIRTHRHTGAVHAFTLAGRWHYLEYPDDVNEAGSYLFEPAGSVHTLHVPADTDGPTDGVFISHGANQTLDDAGEVVSVTDAHSVLRVYRSLCGQQHGVDDPPVVVHGA
ncbi:MAG: 2,4'-dihydroxyacetophenone dioxygenase family protein [Actinomycetes bacterium]